VYPLPGPALPVKDDFGASKHDLVREGIKVCVLCTELSFVPLVRKTVQLQVVIYRWSSLTARSRFKE